MPKYYFDFVEEGCPNCHEPIMGVEYGWNSPNNYDGVSEWTCLKCNLRWGRWTHKLLADGEEEKRYGKQ